MHSSLRSICANLTVLASLAITSIAPAVVFYETGDANHNTAAPTGIYSNSGWQYEGVFGGFLGTMISPQLFITAQHIGVQGATFVHDGVFNGGADVTYNIDTAANSGAGFWDIAGTDLRIYKVNEVFPYFAEIYTLTNELNDTLVSNGMGGPRGADITIGADIHGWITGGSDGVARWGANEVSALITVGSADLLVARFNALTGVEEAFLSSGDSGGGVFIQDGATWKLAGVNYAIDAFYDTNNTTGDNSHFTGAIFDKGGLYEGSDGGGWAFIDDDGTDQSIAFYASRISSSASEINAIIQAVPEPGGVTLAALGALFALRRRR